MYYESLFRASWTVVGTGSSTPSTSRKYCKWNARPSDFGANYKKQRSTSNALPLTPYVTKLVKQ